MLQYLPTEVEGRQSWLLGKSSIQQIVKQSNHMNIPNPNIRHQEKLSVNNKKTSAILQTPGSVGGDKS